MTETRTVLLAGSSGLIYSDSGPEATVWAWTRESLAARVPDVEWRVVAAGLAPSRSLADRALAAAREHCPDVFVLSLASTPFAQEFVRHRVQRRWPKLYGAACAADEWLKGLAGGNVGSRGHARRFIYRVPYWFALHTIGGEPAMAVERAKQNMLDALNALSRLEDTVVICRLPSGSSGGSRARGARYAACEQYVNQALIEACRAHHFAHFRVLDSYGKKQGRDRDGVHFDADVRRFEARLIADKVIESLSVVEQAPR